MTDFHIAYLNVDENGLPTGRIPFFPDGCPDDPATGQRHISTLCAECLQSWVARGYPDISYPLPGQQIVIEQPSTALIEELGQPEDSPIIQLDELSAAAQWELGFPPAFWIHPTGD